MGICGLARDPKTLCKLHKDQQLTIKINENIYYAPIKMLYQTFHDKDVYVFSNGEWLPGQIVGGNYPQELCIINDSLICARDTWIQCEDDLKPAGVISTLDTLKMNSHSVEKIVGFSNGGWDVTTINKYTMAEDEWLFGVLIYHPCQSYTLSNGVIIFNNI